MCVYIYIYIYIHIAPPAGKGDRAVVGALLPVELRPPGGQIIRNLNMKHAVV